MTSGEECNLLSSQMALRKRDDTGICKRKHQIALSEQFALEGNTDIARQTTNKSVTHLSFSVTMKWYKDLIKMEQLDVTKK